MKLFCFFLLFAGLTTAYAGHTQGITLSEKNALLQTVLERIKSQTGYMFLYTGEAVSKAEKVTINVKNASLTETLDLLFQGQPLTYAIVDKTVIIKPKVVSEKAEEKLASLPPPITIKGRITNEDGEPMEVSIQVKGDKTKGTTSNADGYFSLENVNENAILVITGVSIEPEEIKVSGRTIIDVTVKIKIGENEEVMVAYNKTTIQKNVSSITVVKGEQIQNLPNRSFDKSLQGLVPGLLVTSGTGQPGGGLSNFVLRGIATGSDGGFGSTIRNPLIVVDGIPVTQDHTQWSINLTQTPVINPIAQINPSDIESITVLKDAAAIALYGSKASNGVILITTRKGKAGKTRFNFRHQTDIASPLKGKIKVLNQEQYLDMVYQTYRTTNPTLWTDAAILADLKTKFPTKADGSFYPETNWQNEVFDNHASTFSNELSMSGGNERSNFYINLEYTKQNGVVKKSGYDRKSLRVNLENRPVKWLKLGLNSAQSYNLQEYSSIAGGNLPFGVATFNNPLNPVRLENGNYMLIYTYPLQVSNPVAAREYNINKNTSFRSINKLFAELDLFRHIKFSSSLGADFMLMESKEKFDPRLFDDQTNSTGSGRVQELDTRRISLITTNVLSFDKLIHKHHRLNVLVAQEAQIQTQKFLQGLATGLLVPTYDQVSNGTTRSSAGGLARQTQLSYFSQVNYDYNNKYFLTASIRRDGSSLFGDNNRFGTYWSTGLGWIITNEPFMKATRGWLDYLKVRGSIGAAGNSSAIGKYTRYDILSFGMFQGSMSLSPSATPGNPDIKWERTFTWDAGIESRFWNNRVSITADIYSRITSDMVYTTNLGYSTGFVNMLDNIGDIRNNGIEVSLGVDIVKSKNLIWNISANWSTNRNKLVKANVPLALVTGNLLGNEEGRSFNSFYMRRWAGVDPATGLPQWIDSTGKPNYNYNAAKREFVGKPQPDGFGSITHTFSFFKNIQLSASFYYQYGAQVFDSYLLTNDGFYPYMNQDVRALDYWKKPGDITVNPRRVLANTDNGKEISTRFLYNGDYVRLQTMSITYTVPDKISERLKLSNLSLHFRGHNIAIWTPFRGQDPSNASVQGSISTGYPNQRSFSFGINAGF